MRRPVDAQAQDLQRIEMLRQQKLIQSSPNLAALIGASRRKPVRRHHPDEADIRAHGQASKEAQHELRALESIGPAQIMLEALDEAADDMIVEMVDLIVVDAIDSADVVAHDAMAGADEVVGELAEDFLHLVHLD